MQRATSSMSKTDAERAEVSRRNSRLSKGPTSAAGKRRSSQNALKYGLRAKTFPLPQEDPQAVAALALEWHDYYRPKSPVARHLTNECIRANLLADRCDRYRQSELERQVAQAELTWEQARRRE